MSEPSAAQAYNAVASNPQPLLDERDKLRNALRTIRKQISGRQLPFCNDIRDVIKAALLPLLLCMCLGCDGLLPPLPTPTPLPDPVVPVDPVVDPVTPPVVSGFRVLIVEEGQQRNLLTPGQREALTSAPFRSWIASKNAQLRVWDKDVDATRDAAEWRQMLAISRSSLPWIVINGKSLFSGPLPSTVAETEALIERHQP